MDGITNEGVFEDSFRTDVLPGYLGDDHKGSKVMDDVKDVATLVKRFADTKSSHDKKLENVIQKPADDASEEIKAAYRAELATASGAPAAASEYEFFKSEKLPDGMERSGELEDKFRTAFFEHKASKALVKALSQIFEEHQVGAFNSLVETDKQEAAKRADETQKTFDTACTAFKTDFPGEKLAAEARIGLETINKFGSEELKKKLKDANIYENAADLTKWRDSGVPLETLRFMIKVGHETLDASVLGGDTPGGGGGGKKKSMYQRTKDQMGES